MSASECIAYRDDGTLCREPATILDPDRGGMVCCRHDPERWRRFCWTDEDEISMTEAEAEEDAVG